MRNQKFVRVWMRSLGTIRSLIYCQEYWAITLKENNGTT